MMAIIAITREQTNSARGLERQCCRSDAQRVQDADPLFAVVGADVGVISYIS